MTIYKLKDICTIIAGQSPESKYYNTDGDGIPFFQGKADFGELYPTIRVYCSQPTKIAEKDDILLSVRAPVGPTNLAPCKPPYKRQTGIPDGFGWEDMCLLKGAELEEQYRATLEALGEQGGILGKIFRGAVNKISNAAILSRIVNMIDKEKWVSMSSDVKGEIYEGLLKKNAEDVKSGAGQYFTPRPLINAMVECVRPEPMKSVADKAVTGLIQRIPQKGLISGLFANGKPLRSFFALFPVR